MSFTCTLLRFEPKTFCGPRVPQAAIPVSYCPRLLNRPFSITQKQVHCWWRTFQGIHILSFLSVHKTQAKFRDLNLVMQNAWYATFESCFKTLGNHQKHAWQSSDSEFMISCSVLRTSLDFLKCL
jgi:hypothetical protein